MVIQNKYDFGQMVYLITDKDQLPRMITGLLIKPTHIMYEISQGTQSCWAAAIELSSEINVLTKTA